MPKNKILVIAGVLAFFLLVVLFNLSASPSHSKKYKDAAQKVYVPPGEYDEFYAFMSGGYSGSVTVYGLPSGRLFKTIPVFSVDAEKGYGFSEETKPMLETSHGRIPWDDAHHPQLSQTEGVPDGRWLFINANNTPRIARINLKTFDTEEIIEIPNSAGNHASPFLTQGTEYVVASTRFSVPIPQADVAISSYKENFKGSLSFIKVDPSTGHMDIAFQILLPGFNWDVSHAGKNKSHGWAFFSCYNSEEAHTMLEINSTKKDKDFVAAINWKLAEKLISEGKGKSVKAEYRQNFVAPNTLIARSEKHSSVMVLDSKDFPGLVYLLPTPKSPHGVDVDPSGEYIVAGGKLASIIPVHSFTKMLKAIEDKAFDGTIAGIPVLKYESTIAGEVANPGLGPLHTEFDGKGYAYTSVYISSEIVKWKLGEWKVVDRIPSYYSIGHLMIPGGDSRKPWGKYMVALNKNSKDRYLPVGPDLPQGGQLYDISGKKMKLLLDFPLMGEPHYAQAIPSDIILKGMQKVLPLDKNTHPYAAKSENDVKAYRHGSDVHIIMTATRTHFSPDNIEGIRVGDSVYLHVTNLEQDWDITHGFSVMGAMTSHLLLMPGETKTLQWNPKKVGVYPFYCTDFCSALHQEMQGYVRVSPKNSTMPIKIKFDEENKGKAEAPVDDI